MAGIVTQQLHLELSPLANRQASELLCRDLQSRPPSMASTTDEKHPTQGSPAGYASNTDSVDIPVPDAEGYGSSEDHIFKDPAVASHWRGVYETANYENRHRFDPDLRWTAEEEKRVLRKIDFRIMTWAWVMFCALDIHRRNINRAISDNMLPEIGKPFATLGRATDTDETVQV